MRTGEITLMAYKILEMANPARVKGEFGIASSEPFIFSNLEESVCVSVSYLV